MKNILVIFIFTLWAVAFTERKPNIDHLANESMWFVNAIHRKTFPPGALHSLPEYIPKNQTMVFITLLLYRGKLAYA